jgi:hypothetical protein
MSKRNGSLATGAAVIAGLLAILAGALPRAPATNPDPSLDEVEAAFAGRVRANDERHLQEAAAARADRLVGLNRLLDEATDRKDLDSAGRLRERIKAALTEAGRPATGPSAGAEPKEVLGLDAILADTDWEWGSETIRFQADGTVASKGWTSRGLVTTWKVIDTHTVLLYVDRGRRENRYAILSFSPDASSFSEYGFNGKANPLPQHRRAKRP